MARAVLLLVLATFVLVTSGCLEEATGTSARKAKLGAKAVTASVGRILTPAIEPQWYDPETTPHPAFNFPTLSHPAEGASVSEWLKPIPKAELPKPIVGLKQAAQVQGTTSGTGMSLIGSLAILPSGSGTRYVDIRDPLHPKVVGQSQGGTRGSDTIVYPDGRVFAVLATGSGTIFLVDISNPAVPMEPVQIKASRTHKVDVVPGTPIIYNSAGTEIYDASDPENPVKVAKSMPAACHRTYFYIEPAEDYYRAICAGYQTTQLWDIADPRDPKVVSVINMWHARSELPPSSVPPVTFSHFAILSRNHKTLVVGDEMGGGAAMACGVHASTPARDASTPLGAMWFFDVSNEKSPVLKGWLSPSAPATNLPSSCTAHHGRLVPDPEGKRDLLAMGYYGAGVLLVDFTDAASPRILDQFNQGTSVWEAWYYNGYVFTGDGRRGLDAIKFR